MPPGMIWQIVLGSFGVTAAFLLVGGWVILRYQRDRQHFQLMQAALERGVTALPGLVPGWVVSMRQGLMALVLGIGLGVAGWVIALDSTMVREAPADTVARSDTLRPPFPPPPEAISRRDDPQDGSQAPEGPGPRGRPGPRNVQAGPPRDGPPPPPRMSPAMERWHRVETERLTGLVTMCAGGILAALGLVRIGFARTERRYATAAVSAGSAKSAS